MIENFVRRSLRPILVAGWVILAIVVACFFVLALQEGPIRWEQSTFLFWLLVIFTSTMYIGMGNDLKSVNEKVDAYRDMYVRELGRLKSEVDLQARIAEEFAYELMKYLLAGVEAPSGQQVGERCMQYLGRTCADLEKRANEAQSTGGKEVDEHEALNDAFVRSKKAYWAMSKTLRERFGRPEKSSWKHDVIDYSTH